MSDGAADDRARATVRRATPSDVTALVGVLARAFDDDRFYNWLLPQDAERATRFNGIFRLILEQMSDGLAETFTTDERSSCALWLRPGTHKLSLLRQAQLLPHFVRALGWRGIPPGMRILDHMDELHARFAPGPHFYLSLLGVDPRLQRRGLGSQLLKPMLERCDRERNPIYLETTRPENVPFYERHGFALKSRAEHRDFPTFFCMRREAR